MRKHILLLVLLATAFFQKAVAQDILFHEAKVMVGDNPDWKNLSFDDSQWQTVSIHKLLIDQGISFPHTFAWYRIHFTPSPELLAKSDLRQAVMFNLGLIDDADQSYINGYFLGKTGKNPKDDGEEQSMWDTERNYVFEDASKINWGGDNVIAIRVYNGGDPGGMLSKGQGMTVPNLLDGLFVDWKETDVPQDDESLTCHITLSNQFAKAQQGSLEVLFSDPENGSVIRQDVKKVSLKGHGKTTLSINYPKYKWNKVELTYTDRHNGKTKSFVHYPKYVLTPKAPKTPRYNGPVVYGVRPGSPVIFKIPVSGEKPMKYSAEGLPEGLQIDAEQGVLSGSVSQARVYTFTLKATNAHGTMEQPFTLRVGDKIGLTPAMGWNSWNCWGLSVSQEKVMSSATALLDKGLADYGYSYVNIDDAWEAEKRLPDGRITPNAKFPDMKGLGDWLHQRGLKFGIYSSPGPLTCGQYLGSYQHELQDAETYNSWGIDFLKYDWCYYSEVFDTLKDQTVASYVRPYLLMEKYLRAQPRDIWYSLCQYGMGDVWKWGYAIDANSWRTTGDITDTWRSVCEIGFDAEADLYPYAQPGHWNDPDMLTVGKVGWGAELRDSRLTTDEQYSHISLWALLAANMLIGCDLSQIDDFTFGLLCNNEVNAVDQDPLGKQAKREVKDGDIQIWMRPLVDGSHAVGIFNMSEQEQVVDFSRYYQQCGIATLKSARDLWRQQDLDTQNVTYRIAPHGVRFIKITCD